MAKPKRPQDALVTNGWYLELPGLTPLFKSMDGLQKMTENVEIVDAGSNVKYKFNSQIIDFGELSLIYPLKGDNEDVLLEALADQCIEKGLKFPARLVKLHHGKEVFSIACEGFRFKGYTHPTWDTHGEESFEMTYGATVDVAFRI